MKNTIKTIASLFVVSIVLLTTGCLTDPTEPIERTEAMEKQEIDNALKQLESKGIDIDTTELGIYYLADTIPPGATVNPGDTCFLKYVGYFFDGSVFDSSEGNPANKDGVWEFIFGEVDLIPGFEDGISLMSKGAKISMIIPSEYAYGATGYLNIPPYTPLMFDTEMVDLKPVLQP